MNISENFKNCKDFLKENEKDIFLGGLIILVGFLSFGLGRLSRILENKTPLEIKNAPEVQNNQMGKILSDVDSNSPFSASLLGAATENAEQGRNFVASKNGTKYYFPWCEGANKIKEKNKVWFLSKEEAERAGYGAAKNCKGIE